MAGGADKRGGRPAYLNDANYYRLGYQVAAQRMNLDSGRRSLREEDGPTAEDVLFGQFSRRQVPTAALSRGGAIETATQIMHDAERTLAWYAERQRITWRRPFPERLNAPEKRLRRFLKRTVIPCLQLVIAASLRDRDPTEADWLAGQVRRAAAERRVSYRTFYNLACFEAGAEEKVERDGEDNVGWALRYLREALSEAPGDRAAELISWARKDPSLKPLRRGKEFEQLLERFEPLGEDE